MDPNACLRRIEDARRTQIADCQDAIRDLTSWLRGGGFPPRWHLYPLGTQRFRKSYPHLIKPRYSISKGSGVVLDSGEPMFDILPIQEMSARTMSMGEARTASLREHIVALLNKYPPPKVL